MREPDHRPSEIAQGGLLGGIARLTFGIQVVGAIHVDRNVGAAIHEVGPSARLGNQHLATIWQRVPASTQVVEEGLLELAVDLTFEFFEMQVGRDCPGCGGHRPGRHLGKQRVSQSTVEQLVVELVSVAEQAVVARCFTALAV